MDNLIRDKLSIEPPQGSSVALQSPGLELESSESSQEADHPSPVSVLEVPFTEDVSPGSECFERVSAGLQGNFKRSSVLHEFLLRSTATRGTTL
ncbi:unnamed protein product [Ilex paraguariensis]|uniref:Uncharacterized protein n=1 Tax=Ilex paraguariensis TaxID=185542 RepID=A0ABC8RCI7_9AQUA